MAYGYQSNSYLFLKSYTIAAKNFMTIFHHQKA